MEKKIFEFFGAANEAAKYDVSPLQELSDVHLAIVGGGIGDTVLGGK